MQNDEPRIPTPAVLFYKAQETTDYASPAVAWGDIPPHLYFTTLQLVALVATTLCQKHNVGPTLSEGQVYGLSRDGLCSYVSALYRLLGWPLSGLEEGLRGLKQPPEDASSSRLPSNETPGL